MSALRIAIACAILTGCSGPGEPGVEQGGADASITRLQLPDDDPHKMPPPRFHKLSASDRDLMIEALAN